MKRKAKFPDMESDLKSLDERLQEAEIKLAFLEREIEEYKEGVGLLHELLGRLEKKVQDLKDGEESSRKLDEFWKPEEP
jgi:chromosome segregation ATPase